MLCAKCFGRRRNRPGTKREDMYAWLISVDCDLDMQTNTMVMVECVQQHRFESRRKDNVYTVSTTLDISESGLCYTPYSL